MTSLDNLPRSETPTQYDLARWLFQHIEKTHGVSSDRSDALALMDQCMTVIRPLERDRNGKKNAPSD